MNFEEIGKRYIGNIIGELEIIKNDIGAAAESLLKLHRDDVGLIIFGGTSRTPSFNDNIKDVYEYCKSALELIEDIIDELKTEAKESGGQQNAQ